MIIQSFVSVNLDKSQLLNRPVFHSTGFRKSVVMTTHTSEVYLACGVQVLRSLYTAAECVR